MRHLMRVADLTDSEVDHIIGRAAELAESTAPARSPFTLATLFLTPSMRTRVGFQVAAQRLGGSTVSVDELRADATMSSAEPYGDALRVLSGMVDVIATRTPFSLDPAWLATAHCPVINGGDDVEHPTQALIDLAAISRFRGDPRDLRIGLCGDLRMRSATSLLRLLARRPPASLSLIHPDGRGPDEPPGLAAHRADLATVGPRLDVVIMVGLPPGRPPSYLDEAARAPFTLTAELMRSMAGDAVVLSPLPVVDEIMPDAKRDPRVRMFDQSDHAVFVRMAILESFGRWWR